MALFQRSVMFVSLPKAARPSARQAWRARLHTIYVGAAPEYGKETFFNRMTREIDHVKSLYPGAHFVGIADGAKSNWDFLGRHIDEQALDFYHASQYLTRACA
jgi:hypothetical protein